MVEQIVSEKAYENSPKGALVAASATTVVPDLRLVTANLPDPVPVSLRRFVEAFTGEDATVCLRLLGAKLKNLRKPTKEELQPFEWADKKGKRRPGYPGWLRHELKPYGVEKKEENRSVEVACLDDEQHKSIIELRRTNRSNEARGIYFVVNGGGQKKDDITKFRAFFYEDDERPLSEQWTRAMRLPIPPHIVVKTRSSLHCYWLAAPGVTGEEWEDVQRALIVAFESDPSIHDRSRVMRLPGFDHTSFDFETKQTARVPVTVLKFDTGERLTARELLDALNLEPVSEDQFKEWQDARKEERDAKAGKAAGLAKPKAPVEPLSIDAAAGLQAVFDGICTRLDVVGGGDNLRAFCPACDDPNPSFLITLDGDKILMTCFAGCGFDALCASLGVKPKQLFASPKKQNHAKVLTPEAVGEYAAEVFSEPDSKTPLTDSADPILVGSRDVVDIAQEVWGRLEQSEQDRPTTFNYGNILCRVEPAKDDPGHLLVRPLSLDMFAHRAARLAPWMRETKSGFSYIPPFAPVIRHMMATPLNETPIPVLRRITAEPVYGRNGALVNSPGFHQDAAIYYTPRFEPLPVPESPTAEERDQARDFLLDLISDFPFQDDASRDNALAVLLVPFVREMIDGPVPLAMLQAAVPRTGKTKLLKILLGAGNYISITYSPEDTEMRKKVTSCVMSGFASVIVDNVADVLDSPSLASVLTGDVWNDRLLGTNQNCNVRPTIQWAATANNPTMSRELAGRCLTVRLVAKTDRPELRTDFKYPDIEMYAKENRAKIVHAALTLVRHWVSCGRPAPKNLRLGGFESYVYVIGGILQACGLSLLQNYKEASDAVDVERQAVADLCNGWFNKFPSADGQGSKPTQAGELWDAVGQHVDGLPDVDNKLKFGHYLGKLHDRYVTYEGPERDPFDGERAEDVPGVVRQFVIRKLEKRFRGSIRYALDLVSEQRTAASYERDETVEF